MTDLAWMVLVLLAVLLLFPLGFLAGYARGRHAKLLTALHELLGGEDDRPGDS